MENNEFTVNESDVQFKKVNKNDCIALTDLAGYTNLSEPKAPIVTQMRSKDIISYLGFQKKLHNPDFKRREFETFEVEIVYADEADLLNVALFGKTAVQRRKENLMLKDNILN